MHVFQCPMLFLTAFTSQALLYLQTCSSHFLFIFSELLSSFLSPPLSSAPPVSHSLSLPCIDFKMTSCRLRLPGSTDQWGKVGLHLMTRDKEHKPQLLNLAN